MGARWMQQKQAKIRKERRSHLKPYALHMRNTKLPNKDVLKEYKDRGQALGVDHRYLDSLVRIIWGVTVPQNNNEPRQAAQQRRKEVKNEVPKQFFIRLDEYRSPRKSFGCFFEEGNGKAYFVQVDLQLQRTRKSMDYRNLHVARSVFQMEQITWNSWELIPPPVPSS